MGPPAGAGGLKTDLKYNVWEMELRDDEDREFLLDGIKHGFHIVNEQGFKQVECENYNSTLNCVTQAAMEKQIKTELSEGRYEIVEHKPVIVSALGAVEKPSGGIRLIHDASRPAGVALNDYAQLEYKLKFQLVSDAENLLAPNVFMTKVDLKSAYRSVAIHPDDYCVTGLK